jgi:protein involved in polysaccharide export with SLBB domain
MVAMAMLVCSQASLSQTTRGTQTPDMLGGEDLSRFSCHPHQPQGVALESTIDPEVYFVGPSDVFAVNIWTSPSLNWLLTVTPEGTLVIPTVGEVKVADVPLVNAKRMVIDKIMTKYLGGGNASVTLVTPRPIVVTVTGQILHPGSYVLAAYNRVDKAIEQANKVTMPEDQEALTKIQEDMSTRNIKVKHKDGRVSPVDITKFFATKIDKFDPYLREGDLVNCSKKG